MSFLDDAMKSVSQAAQGAAGGLMQNLMNNITNSESGQAIMGKVTNFAGGIQSLATELPALAEKFGAAGLGDQMRSWISNTAANMTITPEQVESALGQAGLTELAQKFGINPADAAQSLSALLPNAINALTPNGQISDAVQVANDATGQAEAA